MKNCFLPLVIGMLLTVMLLELLLHAFPVSTGYAFMAVDAGHPVLHGTPGFQYVYSKDWSFHLENYGRLNNYGFRSSYDYAPNSDAVVMIGNSFVQADAIRPPDTMTERLGALLHRPAYAVGVDGFALVDYLVAARWANATFRAPTLLVLLTSGDLGHSCTPRPAQHFLRFTNGTISLEVIDRPIPSLSRRLANDSKLFRYLYDNLHVGTNWPRGWRRDDDEAPRPAALAGPAGCADPAFDDAATRYLLNGFRHIEVTDDARVIFVLAPHYRGEQQAPAGAVRDVDGFADRAADDGFAVVRLDTAFAAALRSGISLDLLPIDGHWNAAANDIAAQVTAAALVNSPR